MPNKIRDKIKKYLRLTNKQYTIPEIQKNMEKAINLLFLWDFFLLKNALMKGLFLINWRNICKRFSKGGMLIVNTIKKDSIQKS